MMTLTQNTRLQRLPNLRLELDRQNFIKIRHNSTTVKCGANGLAILSVFQQIYTLAEALEKLKTHVTGQQAWLTLTADILYLYEVGILVDVDMHSPEAPLTNTPQNFAHPRIHIEMLNDIQRTTAYLQAIEAVVQSNDIVLEIGTGTGVLSTRAAQAGAQHVYAIEATAIGQVAQAIFADNDVAEHVELVQGWSTEIELLQKADVLISEIIGNDPFDEKVLEVTRDASQRLLKSDARFIPSHMRVYAIPFQIPAEFLQTVAVTDANLAQWQSAYHINFPAFQRATQQEAYGVVIPPHRAKAWHALSEPILLTEIDFAHIKSLLVHIEAEVVATQTGFVHGVMIYPDLQLSPDIMLTRHPHEVDEQCSWRSYVWLFNDPPFIKAGNGFKIRYLYGDKNTTVALIPNG